MQPGTCECRRDMRWNAQEGECQFYMDVDCSSFTYDTPASAGVLSAVSRAQACIIVIFVIIVTIFIFIII